MNYVGAYRGASGANALLAEVIGDQVVPNSATDELGALLGFTPTDAAVATAVPPTAPSLAAPMPGSQWIRYKNLPADMTTGFPGMPMPTGPCSNRPLRCRTRAVCSGPR